MDTAIQMFKFEGGPDSREIRVVQDGKGEPWFVAKDVCDVLGIANSRDAVERLDDDERDDVALSDTIGRQQRMSIVNESGLYSLIVRSDKPEARPFRKWVTSEVLPSIRKTGSYSIGISAEPTALDLMEQMLAWMRNKDKQDAETRADVAQIKAVQEAATATLLELPPPTTAAPEKSLRAALNESVRAYAQKTGVAFPDVWSKLYRELKYRTSFDAPTRAKHTRKSALDLVEEAGLLPELYAIAREVLS